MLASKIFGASEFSGLLLNFEDLVKKNNSQLKEFNKMENIKTILPDTESIQSIELTQKQLETILFLSPEYLNELFISNSCALYVLLKEDVSIFNDQKLEYLETKISYRDGKSEVAKIPNDLFSELYFKNKCSKQKDYFNLIKVGNLKTTLERQKIQPPDDEKSCVEFFDKWKSNPETPHLCSVVWTIEKGLALRAQIENSPEMDIPTRAKLNEEVRRGNKFSEEISDVEYSLFGKLCKNIHNRESFCLSYNQSNFWKNIENFSSEDYKVRYKCANLLKVDNPKDLTRNQILNCIKKFEANPNLCETKGQIENNAILPLPDCNQISEALLNSKLITDYHDCPVDIENMALVNSYRILRHFGKVPENIISNDCKFTSYATIYDIYQESKELNKWPLSLCYIDPAVKTEKCEPYVPGNHPTLTFAQNNVISNISYRSKLSTTRQTCQIISSTEYKPDRLKFRGGCFAIIDKDSCQGISCPLKLFIDGKDSLKIYSKGDNHFAFEKYKFNSPDIPLLERFSNFYNLRTSEIRSLTNAKFFIESNKKGIMIGQGCLEELIPNYYQSSHGQHCTPMPFIIDGYKELNQKSYFVIRLANDDIHSPRIISWTNILNSVFRHMELNPIKKWSLYGIN